MDLVVKFISHLQKKHDLESSKIYPLNLSILLSGGKENNYDCLSTGEGTDKSSSRIYTHFFGCRIVVFQLIIVIESCFKWSTRISYH